MINIPKNEGKVFEDCWRSSVPDTCFIYRLNDNAGSFGGGSNLRFATSNICDYIMHDDISNTMYCLELKTTKNGAFTYWRSDFEDKEKKQTFMIKKNQILGLQKASKHKIICGFLLNLRGKVNRTYFIMIDDFIDYTSTLDKKSFNEEDILQMNPMLIEQTLKKVNYKYNVGKFLQETKL
jgi:recombination protein U